MSFKFLLENWKKFVNENKDLNLQALDNQYDSAHVVIKNSSGDFLVVKRSEEDEWMPGKWSLPGGGKNPGENLLHTAIREVKEETGLDITVENMTFLESLSIQQEHAFFIAINPIGTIRLDSENTNFAWVKPKDLIQQDCVPDLLIVLNAVSGISLGEQKIPKDFTNKIKGGKADNMQPSDFDPQKLKKGYKFEKEHTDDPDIPWEIAADHEAEFPEYYDELEKMEKKLKKGANMIKIKLNSTKKETLTPKGGVGHQTIHFEEDDCGMYEGTCEDGELHEIELFYEERECGCGEMLEEAEYQGRKVALNKPMRGDVKKFKVFVRDPKTGNVKKVNFGDPNMKIKKSNPARRKSFRARHRCSNPGPKTKARYWSCKKW